MNDPFYLEDLMAEPDRLPESAEAWATAQKYEALFWVWYIRDKNGFTDREELRAAKAKFLQGYLEKFGISDTVIAGEVLDVGCGPVSIFEGVSGTRVMAIDPNLENYKTQLPDFAKLGQMRNCYYRSCYVQDVHSKLFDVAWSWNVLCHTINWYDMIAHMYQVLKPGGILLLGVNISNKPPDKRRKVCHPAAIPATDLLNCVTECGFEIESHTPINPKPSRYMMILRATK